MAEPSQERTWAVFFSVINRLITVRTRMKNALSRWCGALIGIAICAQAGAESPDHPTGVSACVSFKGDTAVLSDAAKKSLDNLAKFIRQTPQDLAEISVIYGYLTQPGNDYSDFSTAKIALVREEAIYRALSARLNAELANTRVFVDFGPVSQFDPAYCEVGVTIRYEPRKEDEYRCQPSRPECIFLRCDEKGCTRQSSKQDS